MPARTPTSSPDEQPLLDALVQVSFSVTTILTRVASAHDLSLTQLRVLAILRDHTPTMSELAEHLGIDRSSVSGLVDRASRRDLVKRVASEVDGRSSRVTLTRAGQAMAAEGAEAIGRETDALTAGLSDREQQTLTRLLQRLIDPVPSGLA